MSIAMHYEDKIDRQRAVPSWRKIHGDDAYYRGAD